MNGLCYNLNENDERLPTEWYSPYIKFETRKSHSIFIELSVHSCSLATVLSVKGCVSWAVSLISSDQQRSLSCILRCHQPSVNYPGSWWRHGRKVGGSVQLSRSVVHDCLRPHGQHTRPPCPSPTPRVYSNPCPPSQWRHPNILSSVVPFSSCLQSFPAAGSFQMSQFFAWGGQSTGVSASASAGGWRRAFWEVETLEFYSVLPAHTESLKAH